MRRSRTWWDEDEGQGIYLGSGSMYDLRDADVRPRLADCRSVSPNAARALNRTPPATACHVGFRTGPRRG